MSTKRLIRSTTVLSIRREGSLLLCGDGQVTLGESVIKHSAKKISNTQPNQVTSRRNITYCCRNFPSKGEVHDSAENTKNCT